MNKKRALSYLMALFFLFSQGMSSKDAKAELDKSSNNITESDDYYEILPIKTMFNATEKELNKEVNFDNTINIVNIIINGEHIISLLDKTSLRVYENSDRSLPEVKSVLESGHAVILEDLEKEGYKIERGVDFVSRFSEPSSGITVFYEYSKNYKYYYLINENYFESMYKNNGKDTLDLSFQDICGYLEYNGISYENNIFFTKKEFMSKITVKRLLEIYKEVIPKEKWPVRRYVEKQTNASLPIINGQLFQGDILDNIFFAKFDTFNENSPFIKYCLLIGNNSDYSYRDLFTNELAFDEDGIVQKAYLKNIGYGNFKKLDSIQCLTFNAYYNQSYDPFYMPEIQEYIHNLPRLKSIEDFIDFYQHLPLEYQVDYSYFDFSKSPNVVQEEIKPGSRDFIIDYYNNVLYPVNKPNKVKELIKRS